MCIPCDVYVVDAEHPDHMVIDTAIVGEEQGRIFESLGFVEQRTPMGKPFGRRGVVKRGDLSDGRITIGRQYPIPLGAPDHLLTSYRFDIAQASFAGREGRLCSCEA